jgi:hypothetical protein
MKIIKLTECQFQRIFEGKNGNIAPSFNGGNINEYPKNEISTTANVTKNDGDIDFGDAPTTDKIANQMTTQNYYANGLKTARNVNIF